MSTGPRAAATLNAVACFAAFRNGALNSADCILQFNFSWIGYLSNVNLGLTFSEVAYAFLNTNYILKFLKFIFSGC
jgi:hypothetical protein